MSGYDDVRNITPHDRSFAGEIDATRGTSIAKEVETAARQWLRIKEPEYCSDEILQICTDVGKMRECARG